MEKRDLENDLKICEKATPGPWEPSDISGRIYCPKGYYVATVRKLFTPDGLEDDTTTTSANMKFIANAREGWPYAIKRAIEAEKKVEQLIELCREVIDRILPNESIEKCDMRRDWAYEKLKEIMGIHEED